MNAKNTGIAIISPSGYAQEETDFRQGIRYLEGQGYRVCSYYHHDKRFERFAATDNDRIAQFHDAASNPEVQIIMALRGGYGLSRILPHLDYGLLAQSQKLFVGHSDFTAFSLALLSKTGTCSFSGPMVCNDFASEKVSRFMQDHFWQCVTSQPYTLSWQASGNPVHDASGILWGGNLSMLIHLAGTPWMPPIEGGILFVEDIHEHPYRVERMLLQLRYAGILDKQKALVLGDFSNYQLTPYDNGYDFGIMLDYLRETLGIPVFTGLPLGHIKDKVTLPIGCHARLISNGAGIQLEMSGYPTLAI